MKKFLLIALFLFSFFGEMYSQVNCDTTIPPPSLSNYILPYPVGKTYCITQGNCSTGGHANLFALDFNTQLGDTISACRSGMVVFVNEQYSDSDWVNGHENNVFIQHNDGTRIRYTHLKQFGVFVNIGDFVTAGQPIALSGSSGNTGGNPHLHLQAFRDGTSFNGFNSIPLNFSNTDGPVNSHNMCILNGCYNALNPVSIVSNLNTVPSKYILEQNFPNPFNPTTKIRFSIPVEGDLKLCVYDILGQEVAEILNGRLKEGYYEVNFDAGSLTSGIYFYRLGAEKFVDVKKMIILK